MTHELTTYKGLQVVSPTPDGDLAASVNNNFTAIADTLGNLSCVSVANEAARLALTPTTGQRCLQTDTDTFYEWDGSQWIAIQSGISTGIEISVENYQTGVAPVTVTITRTVSGNTYTFTVDQAAAYGTFTLHAECTGLSANTSNLDFTATDYTVYEALMGIGCVNTTTGTGFYSGGSFSITVMAGYTVSVAANALSATVPQTAVQIISLPITPTGGTWNLGFTGYSNRETGLSPFINGDSAYGLHGLDYYLAALIGELSLGFAITVNGGNGTPWQIETTTDTPMPLLVADGAALSFGGLNPIAYTANYSNLTSVPSSFTPSAHAGTHVPNGSDDIFPDGSGYLKRTGNTLSWNSSTLPSGSGANSVILAGNGNTASGENAIAMGLYASAADPNCLAMGAGQFDGLDGSSQFVIEPFSLECSGEDTFYHFSIPQIGTALVEVTVLGRRFDSSSTTPAAGVVSYGSVVGVFDNCGSGWSVVNSPAYSQTWTNCSDEWGGFTVILNVDSTPYIKITTTDSKLWYITGRLMITNVGFVPAVGHYFAPAHRETFTPEQHARAAEYKKSMREIWSDVT